VRRLSLKREEFSVPCGLEEELHAAADFEEVPVDAFGRVGDVVARRDIDREGMRDEEVCAGAGEATEADRRGRRE